MVKCATNETNPDGGGKSITKDCDCHLMVEKVEVSTNQHDGIDQVSVKCEFVVLASTVPEERTKKITEFFPVSGKAAGKFLNLAIAAGLMTKDQWKSAQASGVELDIDETLLKGRQICAEIRMEKYAGKKPEHQGKSFANIGFRTYHVFDERCKAWPKDPDAIQFAAPIPGTSANAPAAPATQAATSSSADSPLW